MKKVAIIKTIKAFKFEINDQKTRDEVLGTLMLEFPDYYIQCDDLNNGPAEMHNGEFVVDVWEDFPGKCSRFTQTSDGKVDIQDR
jgi:hypothetical protein